MSWEVLDIPPHTIVDDGYLDGVRFLIVKASSHLCAYVDVPLDHPLAGFDYEMIPLRCHGGLTFASSGAGLYPEGFYWYGWDYGHVGDAATYHFDEDGKCIRPGIASCKQWTVAEVREEIFNDVIDDFKLLMALAERIKPAPAPVVETIHEDKGRRIMA